MELFENIKLLEDASVELYNYSSDYVNFNNVNIDNFEKAEYLISLFPTLQKSIIDSYLKHSTRNDIPPDALLKWIYNSNYPPDAVISHVMFMSKDFFLANIDILASHYDFIKRCFPELNDPEIKLFLKATE